MRCKGELSARGCYTKLVGFGKNLKCSPKNAAEIGFRERKWLRFNAGERYFIIFA